MDKQVLRNKFFYLALSAVLISIIYWSCYSLNAYHTYQEYGDVGLSAYDMYYHIHYASILNGFQYLVFANHISPDQLFILPIFALFPSVPTLLFIQAIVISLTGLVIFFVSRTIIKNEKISLLLCLAFLINPGTFGILLFDYHAEMLLPILFMLMFYLIKSSLSHL